LKIKLLITISMVAHEDQGFCYLRDLFESFTAYCKKVGNGLIGFA
jgi:hypothetical protein